MQVHVYIMFKSLFISVYVMKAKVRSNPHVLCDKHVMKNKMARQVLL